jgi:FMN phosphatase YigB (HAD superfamily)
MNLGVNEMLGYVNANDIAHVSFDFWNTLFVSNPEFKDQRNKLFSTYAEAFTLDQIGSVFSAVGRKYNASMISGARTVPAALLYNDVCCELEIPSPNATLLKNSADALFLLNQPLQTNLYLWELMQELSMKSITISLTSNTAFIEGAVLEFVFKELKAPPKFLFKLYSDEVGVGKPHFVMFHRIREELSLSGKEIDFPRILHIGDDAVCDKAGAEKCGIKSILI